MLGQKYTDFLKIDSTTNRELALFRSLRFQNPRPQEHLCEITTRDGDIKFLRVQTYGATNRDGDVVLNHGLAQDITGTFKGAGGVFARMNQLKAVEATLTERERNVFDQVINGRLNKAIARQLTISERGVERIRSRLMAKFEVESSAQLVVKGTELRLFNELIDSTEFHLNS
ncbi:MAG: LuxR C-terminal-related transcriptional regulator [Pirellulaceae bacterium]